MNKLLVVGRASLGCVGKDYTYYTPSLKHNSTRTAKLTWQMAQLTPYVMIKEKLAHNSDYNHRRPCVPLTAMQEGYIVTL